MAKMQQAQLFWDHAGAASGWVLRYHDERGVEYSFTVADDMGEDAPTGELASAVAADFPSLSGTAIVFRGERRRGFVSIDGAQVVNWSAL